MIIIIAWLNLWLFCNIISIPIIYLIQLYLLMNYYFNKLHINNKVTINMIQICISIFLKKFWKNVCFSILFIYDWFFCRYTGYINFNTFLPSLLIFFFNCIIQEFSQKFFILFIINNYKKLYNAKISCFKLVTNYYIFFFSILFIGRVSNLNPMLILYCQKCSIEMALLSLKSTFFSLLVYIQFKKIW